MSKIVQTTCPSCGGIGRKEGSACKDCSAVGLIAWDEHGRKVKAVLKRGPTKFHYGSPVELPRFGRMRRCEE